MARRGRQSKKVNGWLLLYIAVVELVMDGLMIAIGILIGGR